MYDEHSILRHRPDRCSVGFCCASSAGGATGRATAHHQPSCRPQRHLLPPADRLPVATVATRISTLWHGLITFKPGETPARGYIHIECSTTTPLVMHAAQLLPRPT